MSDASQGPGWWVAADGRWYPPEQHPDAEHRSRWAGPTPEPAAPAADRPDAPQPAPTPGPAVEAGGAADATARRRGPLGMAIVALVVVAVVAAAVLVLTRSDGTDTVAAPGDAATAEDAAGATAVVLEPVGFAGTDPFTDAMSVREVTEFPADVRAVIEQRPPGSGPAASTPSGATPAVVRVGTEPGLYGGTSDEQACDASELVEFLDGNPAQAAAWAEAQRLPDATAVGDFAGSLTPVVLTTDTLVTNHGFVDGRANPYQAVLQAGTAVLVDDEGVPRVKCSCGNPLAPVDGDPTIGTTTGDAWSGFDAGRVTAVEGGAPVRVLVVVDLDTGANIERAVGAAASSRSGSGVAVGVFGDTYGGGSTIKVSADGMTGTWEEVHRTDVILSGVGYGDGAFLAVGARLGSGSAGTDSSQVLRGSADGRTWSEVGSIAGADIRDVAFAGGRWIAVGWSDPGDGQAVTYASDDGATWSLLTTIERPAEFGGATGFDSVATDGTTLVAALRGNAGARLNPHTLYRSTDGVTWVPTSVGITDSPFSVGFGDGGWLAIGTETLGSDDGATWSPVGDAPGAEAMTAPTGPTRDRGEWFAATFAPPMGPEDPGSSTLERSSDGAAWTPDPAVALGAGDATDFAVAA